MSDKTRYGIGPSIVFEVDSRYIVVKPLGQGAYGLVVQAQDTVTGEDVAIKRVQPFVRDSDAKRALRELRILREVNHPNVIRLRDVLSIDPEQTATFDYVYMVTDLMSTTLGEVLRSSVPLLEAHVQYLTYQLFVGLAYLHSMGIIHRDLKPDNLLLNAACELRICDFGLARSDVVATYAAMSEYVVTRSYRAPEVICDRDHYTAAIDVWAAGCILCELHTRKQLFVARDQVHQITVIMDHIGTPTQEEIAAIRSDNARRYVAAYPYRERKSPLCPAAGPAASALIEALLVWSPAMRITAEQAVSFPFVPDDLRDASVELRAEQRYHERDIEAAAVDEAQLRRLIVNEALWWHREDVDGWCEMEF